MSTIPSAADGNDVPVLAGTARSVQSGPETGGEMLAVMLRRKGLILLVLLIFTILAVGGTMMWRSFAPLYTARAYIRVAPPKITTIVEHQPVPHDQEVNRIMRTHATAIMTDDILRKAIEIGINSTTWYSQFPNIEEAMQEIIEDVTVAPVVKTEFLQVSMTGTDRESITRIVNCLAQAATTDATSRTQSQRAAQIAELEKAFGQTDEQSRAIQDALDGLLGQKVGEDEVGEARETLVYEMQNIMLRTRNTRETLKSVVGNLEALRAKTREELAEDAMIRSRVEIDGLLTQLNYRKTNEEVALQMLKDKYGDDHQSVRRQQIMVNEITDKYAAQERIVTSRVIDETLSQLTIQKNVNEKELGLLATQQNEVDMKLAKIQQRKTKQNNRIHR